VEIKSVDSQGRILLTKEWREKYLKGKKAMIIYKGDSIEIRPLDKSDLTKHFDKLAVDLKLDLSDWHNIKKELQSA